MTEQVQLHEQGRQDAGLSHAELWFRYFELGGMSTAIEVEAFLYGALVPTTHDSNLIAVALNERFSELGRNHPIPYDEEEDRDRAS